MLLQYLIKQLVVSRGQDDIKKDMVTQIITGLQERLLVNSSFDSRASFLAVLDNNQTNLQMDELVKYRIASNACQLYLYILRPALLLVLCC